MNIANVSPAPWYSQWQMNGDLNGHKLLDKDGVIGRIFKEDDAEFMVLARQAFEILMKRPNWGVLPIDAVNWQAVERRGRTTCGICSVIMAEDPFTALVEADNWYKKNVENGVGGPKP